MRDYDDENQADDYRNNKMSDLASENESLKNALYDIREVFIGSEGFVPETCPEAYLKRLFRQMFDIANKALRRTL